MKSQRPLSAFAGWAVALSAALIPGVSVPSAVSCPATTNSHWSAYSGSPAQAAACGLTTYPLTSVARLPDGGARSYYAAPGHPIVASYPPGGFNPRTASAAERNLYGIPPEPPTANSIAHAHWVNMINHIKSWVKPSAFLVGVPGIHNTYSSGTKYSINWSGYEDVESAGYFHYAYGEFVQPYAYYSSSCQYRDETTWTGIGGDPGSTALGQDGTFIGNKPGLNEYQAWVEVVPDEPMVAVNLYATSGQDFEADTNYGSTSQGNGYNWFMENYYTGVVGTFSQATSSYSGGTTEFIAEDPLNLTPYLSNFETFSFAFVASAAQYNPVNAYPNNKIIMTDNGKSNGNLKAVPSALTNSGYSFTDTQHSCQ